MLPDDAVGLVHKADGNGVTIGRLDERALGSIALLDLEKLGNQLVERHATGDDTGLLDHAVAIVSGTGVCLLCLFLVNVYLFCFGQVTALTL